MSSIGSDKDYKDLNAIASGVTTLYTDSKKADNKSKVNRCLVVATDIIKAMGEIKQQQLPSDSKKRFERLKNQCKEALDILRKNASYALQKNPDTRVGLMDVQVIAERIAELQQQIFPKSTPKDPRKPAIADLKELRQQVSESGLPSTPIKQRYIDSILDHLNKASSRVDPALYTIKNVMHNLQLIDTKVADYSTQDNALRRRLSNLEKDEHFTKHEQIDTLRARIDEPIEGLLKMTNSTGWAELFKDDNLSRTLSGTLTESAKEIEQLEAHIENMKILHKVRDALESMKAILDGISAKIYDQKSGLTNAMRTKLTNTAETLQDLQDKLDAAKERIGDLMSGGQEVSKNDITNLTRACSQLESGITAYLHGYKKIVNR